MSGQSYTPVAPTYITPIKCPKCGASAHLARRSPAVTGDGKGEIRNFTCERCEEIVEMFVND
jgi:hypothetical protein